MNTFQFQDFQKFGQANSESAVKMMGDWAKNWQALTSELTDYSKRAFQDGQATFEKLISAKTVEQAIEIQSSYAKRSIEEYMQQMSKIGSMYTSFGREAYKPVERAVQSMR
ncbi:MAG: phasin family protein [Hyphomicrobium sp.]